MALTFAIFREIVTHGMALIIGAAIGGAIMFHVGRHYKRIYVFFEPEK